MKAEDQTNQKKEDTKEPTCSEANEPAKNQPEPDNKDEVEDEPEPIDAVLSQHSECHDLHIIPGRPVGSAIAGGEEGMQTMISRNVSEFNDESFLDGSIRENKCLFGGTPNGD
ncbi:hypothetical protein BDN70DRAFT_896697 [Pholiota conissans]|uniref:Uncharacterized protein n=1 Tax=Pholiota conissans TaxID=109636 RepID=A0A9P6CY67_9AGAR|nr:hypothetical protein BDN70DRAFT_896697 [Pholiota conissans]